MAFPLQQDVLSKRVGELKSNNNIAWKLLTNSVKLIKISITDNNSKWLHISYINNILPSLILLHKKPILLIIISKNFKNYLMNFSKDGFSFGVKKHNELYTYLSE